MWGSLELHTTKSRYFDFLASCAIFGKNHQFLRVENVDEIFSFLSNSRVNHKIEILSYGVPKSTNRLDFVHIFTFLNRAICQRYLHTSNTLYTRKIMISTCFRISAHRQTTKEILHKNILDCTDISSFDHFRKSWVSGEKIYLNPRHLVLSVVLRKQPETALF